MKLMSRGALDPRWTRHHTPVVADFMLATVRIVRKLPTTGGAELPVYDRVTGAWSTGSFETVLEDTPARIQPYGIIGDMVVGQDTTGRRLIRVQIENIQTGAMVDDILFVTAAPDNPDLANHTYEIRGTFSSSNAWISEFVCEGDVKANP